MKRLPLLLIVIVVLYGCAYDFDPKTLPIKYSPRVVVTSTISPDDPVTVLLTWSRNDGDDTSFERIDGVEVEIFEDGVKVASAVTVRGIAATDFYPRSGHEYSLRAEVPDYGTVTASTSIPEPPSMKMQFIESRKDADTYSGYYHLMEVSEIVPTAGCRAVWLTARYRYQFQTKFFSPQVYYPTTMDIDQINLTINDDNSALTGSTNYCEGFVRIPSDYAAGQQFTLSFHADAYTRELVYNEWLGDYEHTLCIIDEIDLCLVAPSDEYDRYFRSLYRQYYYSTMPDTPFMKEDVVVESNITGGLGVFAGYATCCVAYNDYPDYFNANFSTD